MKFDPIPRTVEERLECARGELVDAQRRLAREIEAGEVSPWYLETLRASVSMLTREVEDLEREG